MWIFPHRLRTGFDSRVLINGIYARHPFYSNADGFSHEYDQHPVIDPFPFNG